MTDDSSRIPVRAATHPLSRRGFLTAGTAGLAGASLSACCGDTAQHDAPATQLPIATPTGVEDAAWAGIRARFILESGTAYMNNASLGMPPASVAAAVGAGYEALSREPLHGKHDLGDVIASLYTYYVPGVEIPSDEELIALVEG